ncbi:MAG: V-type ATP synthase subunit D [Candidatus Aminicenantes bacterium]|nr:V-type ATP synthase subunit D [Candidatus Aminicenantes bacterium]MDH5466196.1 V-type ATP synthase subunit D [Candidatus Aminicenantes bacterium]MDH5704525.1 V-type ATP synthase subunit D [Candidatus Aminicenantes bacterium]
MRLSVNPNRMELLRLRRRLVLAERGHKLLKDKLEEIMRRFLQLMRRLFEIQEEISVKLEKAMVSFALVRTRSSRQQLEKLIPEGELIVSPQKERVFNVFIPRFEIAKKKISDYDLLNTESELDIGVKKTEEVIEDLMEMSRLWKAVELLSREIEVTRRRVNALEHILIPNIRETIKYISSRLEEMERSYQVQLMRVKEIVRQH